MISSIKKCKKIIKSFINTEKYIDETIRFELLKQDYEKEILKFTGESILNYKNQGVPQIIVSLTTYNKRIYDVHLVIESLFRQTIMPNKIILWLAEDEFDDMTIPRILKNLELKGLEIGYCKDLKSYKKLIPTLEKYTNDIIITVDDDILYPIDFVENLYKEYKKDEKNIYFYIGHKIILNDGKVQPYCKWKFNYQGLEKTFLTLPTGVGGILYPPKILDKEVMNIKNMFELAPKADDIWFKAMGLLKGVKCKKIKLNEEFSKKFVQIKSGQDIALHLINLGENQNDIQLKAVFDYYNLWEKLKGEKN